MGMGMMVEWIDDSPQMLGALSPQEAAVVSVDAADEVEKKFSTEEKLLIASLLVSILSIAWQAFQWRKEHEKK